MSHHWRRTSSIKIVKFSVQLTVKILGIHKQLQIKMGNILIFIMFYFILLFFFLLFIYSFLFYIFYLIFYVLLLLSFSIIFLTVIISLFLINTNIISPCLWHFQVLVHEGSSCRPDCGRCLRLCVKQKRTFMYFFFFSNPQKWNDIFCSTQRHDTAPCCRPTELQLLFTDASIFTLSIVTSSSVQYILCQKVWLKSHWYVVKSAKCLNMNFYVISKVIALKKKKEKKNPNIFLDTFNLIFYCMEHFKTPVFLSGWWNDVSNYIIF